MKSKYKRINITLPEENLKEIDKFCQEEKMSRSELIREASLGFVVKKIENKKKKKIEDDRIKAIKMMDNFRKTSTLKNGAEIIRKFRDERH
jgi:metal-responsive CopG/Arc/MetJ family transcriptional regulator